MAKESPTQEGRSLRVNTPLGDDILLAARLQTEEAVSRPFSLELECLSAQPDVDFSEIVGKTITIALRTEDDERYWNGIVRRFRQGETSLELTRYTMEVVPWLWLLSRTANCRIFQEKTVPEIVKQIFDDHGFQDYKDVLEGSYPSRIYCVQYRESDLDFVSRLLEEEGIHYFFVHENGKHTLVLADSPTGNEAHPLRKEAFFNPQPDAPVGYEAVHGISWQQQIHTTKVALRDFNWETPATDLTAQREEQGAEIPLEVYDYPGEYPDTGEGNRLAKVRLEEQAAGKLVFNGNSSCRAFTPGYRFDLKEHPGGKKVNQALLILQVHHTVAEEGGYGAGRGQATEAYYENRFIAVPHKTPYRPRRRTPRPHVYGSQTAIVVGPSGEEIHTDKYGRIKVQFHWDREGEQNENSSCWVRVSQTWAGKNWGTMILPRIGQEVIVEFLEGDPDRPLVTGCVYNAEAMPPYSLPGNKTISGIKTRSTKEGGSDSLNTIRFEDKKDEEQLFIQAQRNQDVRVKGDSYEFVGNKRHLIVKKDQLEHVEENRHEKVDLDHKEEIGKDRHLKVTGKEARSIGGSLSVSVGGDVIQSFSMNHKQEVGQTLAVKGLAVKIEASTGIELKCGGSSIVLTPAAIFIMGGPIVNINSGAGPPVGPVTAQAVSPAAPEEALEADSADPSETAEMKAHQLETGSGKYGTVQVAAFKPAEQEEDQELHWIEIELLDEDDKPVPGVRYEVTMPDGEQVASGTLDEKGFARIDGIREPGDCTISFPDLDEAAWELA